MKKIFILIAIVALSGCVHQGDANLMNGEFFVSENGVHKFNLDAHKFYRFNFKFGSGMRPNSKEDDESKDAE